MFVVDGRPARQMLWDGRGSSQHPALLAACHDLS